MERVQEENICYGKRKMWIIAGGRCVVKRGVPLPYAIGDAKMCLFSKGSDLGER